MRLSEPDQNQRIVSNSPKVKKQGQKNSDEIEFWRAYFFTSSYSFLYVRVEFGHHMGTIKTGLSSFLCKFLEKILWGGEPPRLQNWSL